MTLSKVRTPKIFCSKPYVVEFTVKRKEIFYTVSLWNESGSHLSLIKSAKYNGEKPESLLTQLINGDAKN